MASQQPYQLYANHPLTPGLTDILILQPNDAGVTQVGGATFDDIPTTTTVTNALAGKQDTLVSGTNIKTVGGSTLLGTTDVPIPITVKVSLTSAQILALNTTPITLVAAQGAGTFINVLSVAMRLTYNTITYATNTTTRIAVGSFSPIVTDSTIISNTSTAFNVICPTQTLTVTGTADWVNIPLKISAVTGNPTAGNSTLDVYTTYNVITL